MRWPSSRGRATVVVNGPHPIGTATAGALDRALGLALAARNGAFIRHGLTGSPSRSYRGDLGPLQTFHGYAGPSSGQANKRTGAAMALPMTGAPDPSTGVVRGRP